MVEAFKESKTQNLPPLVSSSSMVFLPLCLRAALDLRGDLCRASVQGRVGITNF